MNISVKGQDGQKKVSMNTDAIEVKINAIVIIKLLAHNLGESFYEYVEDVASTCLEKLILDPYDDNIKGETRKCMRALIACCFKHPDHQRTLFLLTY